MGGPKDLTGLLTGISNFNKANTGEDPLAGIKALSPEATFTPTTTGPDYTHRSTGTIKGDQVTTTVPSKQKTTNIGTKKYSGKKSYVDVLGESGKFSDQTFDQMMVGADGKPHFEDTPENRKKWEQYHKPKTVTTGTPDKEFEISSTFGPEEEAAEENTGDLATDTKETPDPSKDLDKIKAAKAMAGLLAQKGGTKGNTKGNRRSGTPTSTSPSGSNPKDFGLNLNNQAVNKV